MELSIFIFRNYDDSLKLLQKATAMPANRAAYHDQVNTLKLEQNGCHIADDISKCIFLTENCPILIKISLECVHRGPINGKLVLIYVMAWDLPGKKSLTEPKLNQFTDEYMGQVTKVWLSCYLVLLWNDSKTR